MLKNGTLLKVSPELIQALKNALDMRYLPLIQQARRQRRSLITDDVEPVDTGYNGMFKVIWDNEVDAQGNVTKYRVAITNGSGTYPDYAGYTDVGLAPKATVDLDYGGTGIISVNLRVRYIDEKYTFYYGVFSAAHPEPKPYMEQQLATITYWRGEPRTLSQVWTQGSIYFSQRYWL